MPSDGASHCMTVYDRDQPVFYGTIGMDWQFAGVAQVNIAGASDLVLRNVNAGAFQVYNIANNQLTGSASVGAVGLDWQLGGFAHYSDWLYGQLGRSARIKRTARAGDGGFWWRQWRSRRIECWRRQCRHVRAAVADHTAAHMTAGDSGAWASAGKGVIQQQCGKCLISAAIRALVFVHKVVAWRDVMSLACGF
jgi:hypothetical protein